MNKNGLKVKNRYGIEIVKCCASCKNKRCDNHARICVAGEGIVPSNYLCAQWEMDYGFDTAGRGDGRIKKRMYLDFCYRKIVEENRKAIQYANAKMIFKRKTIDEIRAEYIQEYGDIYINI